MLSVQGSADRWSSCSVWQTSKVRSAPPETARADDARATPVPATVGATAPSEGGQNAVSRFRADVQAVLSQMQSVSAHAEPSAATTSTAGRREADDRPATAGQDAPPPSSKPAADAGGAVRETSGTVPPPSQAVEDRPAETARPSGDASSATRSRSDSASTGGDAPDADTASGATNEAGPAAGAAAPRHQKPRTDAASTTTTVPDAGTVAPAPEPAAPDSAATDERRLSEDLMRELMQANKAYGSAYGGPQGTVADLFA